MASMGIICNFCEEFSSPLQGRVMRKTFWSDWSDKYAVLSVGMLTLTERMGGASVLRVAAVA